MRSTSRSFPQIQVRSVLLDAIVEEVRSKKKMCPCVWDSSRAVSHHLVLCHSSSSFLSLHVVAIRIGVLDKGQAEGAAAVHVTREFRCVNG